MFIFHYMILVSCSVYKKIFCYTYYVPNCVSREPSP